MRYGQTQYRLTPSINGVPALCLVISLCLLSFLSRCDSVFDCHALYVAQGIGGVVFTSVAGFGWIL
jgi:hypothetical protein